MISLSLPAKHPISHPGIAECWLYLFSPLLRRATGEDRHGDHGCWMQLPRCQRTISFIDPDRAPWQHRGTPGDTWKINAGRIWNATGQGYSMDHQNNEGNIFTFIFKSLHAFCQDSAELLFKLSGLTQTFWVLYHKPLKIDCWTFSPFVLTELG